MVSVTVTYNSTDKAAAVNRDAYLTAHYNVHEQARSCLQRTVTRSPQADSLVPMPR